MIYNFIKLALIYKYLFLNIFFLLNLLENYIFDNNISITN